MSTATTSSGDLWAQFKIGFATIDYPYPTLSPIDDSANSIQTINGTSYLMRIGNIEGVPPQVSVSARPVSSAVDLTALNDVTPVNVGGNDGIPNAYEVLGIYTQLPGDPVGSGVLTSFQAYVLTVQGFLQTTVASSASQIPNFNAPLVSDTATRSSAGETFTDTIQHPEYVWVDLGPALSAPTTVSITADQPTVTVNENVALRSGPIATFTVSLSAPLSSESYGRKLVTA
jgi:hypothetical protein